MKELSLFSGAGGGLLGTKLLGWETIGYVEFNDYCQRVLKQRIIDGIFEKAPIFSDIRTFISEGYAESYKGMVDVITAGFPCQPFSVAGKGKAEKDERNMWPETIRIVRLLRPKYCFFENVPGLLTSGYFGRIITDLHESGYNAKWCTLGADNVGAQHERKRLWIKCSNTMQSGLPKNEENPNGKKWNAILYKSRTSCNISRDLPIKWKDGERNHGDIREGNGIPHWMDRISAIGNAQMAQVVQAAWEILSDR